MYQCAYKPLRTRCEHPFYSITWTSEQGPRLAEMGLAIFGVSDQAAWMKRGLGRPLLHRHFGRSAGSPKPDAKARLGWALLQSAVGWRRRQHAQIRAEFASGRAGRPSARRFWHAERWCGRLTICPGSSGCQHGSGSIHRSAPSLCAGPITRAPSSCIALPSAGCGLPANDCGFPVHFLMTPMGIWLCQWASVKQGIMAPPRSLPHATDISAGHLHRQDISVDGRCPPLYGLGMQFATCARLDPGDRKVSAMPRHCRRTDLACSVRKPGSVPCAA